MAEESLSPENPETLAVAHPVRQVERTGPGRQKLSLAEELLAIGSDCASRLSPEVLAIDHGEFLHHNDVPQEDE